MVNRMAKKAMPPSDILISLSCPFDDGDGYAASPMRCRRLLEFCRLAGSGIALYLYVSRDTAPLMEANILDADMILQGRFGL